MKSTWANDSEGHIRVQFVARDPFEFPHGGQAPWCLVAKARQLMSRETGGRIFGNSKSSTAGEGIFSQVLITSLLRANKRIALIIIINCGAYDAAGITRKRSRGARTHRRARTSPWLQALRS